MYSNTKRVFRYKVNNFTTRALILAYFIIKYKPKTILGIKQIIYAYIKYFYSNGYLLALAYKLFEP